MSSDQDQHSRPEAQSPADIGAALEDAGAEQVYLMTMEGCSFCAAMKDAMADQIEAGVVAVLDVEDDDLALDIMEQTNDEVGVPSIIVETDEGDYHAYQ